MIDSRFSLAASCSRSTKFFNASCTSFIAFSDHQLPEAPPPPLLPPPKPPNPPPPEYPPEPPPKPPPRQPPPMPPSIGPIHQPPPPLRPPTALRPARAMEKITQMTKSISHQLTCEERSLVFPSRRTGGWPDRVTPRSSAIYFASIHAAASIAGL